MRRKSWSTIAVLGLALGLSPMRASLRAETLTMGGAQFEVPQGWQRTGSASWVFERDGERLAALTVSVSPGFTPVNAASLLRGREALEAEMERRGFERIEIVEARSQRLDGAPAVLLGAHARVQGQSLAQLDYVISCKDTLSLTFTCEASVSRSLRPEFERLVSSLRVLEPAGIWDRSPASLCGAFLGLLAGMSCAAWRRRIRVR